MGHLHPRLYGIQGQRAGRFPWSALTGSEVGVPISQVSYKVVYALYASERTFNLLGFFMRKLELFIPWWLENGT